MISAHLSTKHLNSKFMVLPETTYLKEKPNAKPSLLDKSTYCSQDNQKKLRMLVINAIIVSRKIQVLCASSVILPLIPPRKVEI